jgi:hypothetical protein
VGTEAVGFTFISGSDELIMDDRDDRDAPETTAIRNLVERVDTMVRDAESVRAHVDRMMCRRPFWPERRQPKHWQQDSVPHDREPEGQ